MEEENVKGTRAASSAQRPFLLKMRGLFSYALYTVNLSSLVYAATNSSGPTAKVLNGESHLPNPL
jgi:hypothetical protein